MSKTKSEPREELKLKLREELMLDRKNRARRRLYEEALINIIAEQEIDRMVDQPPPPPAAPMEQGSQVPPGGDMPQQFSVDDMIEELNAIRSGRSFSDPEIYGRLVTFFKGTSEEDRAILDNLLGQIAEMITGVSGLDDQGQQEQSPVGSSQAQMPPGGAPQSSAPMPGVAGGVGTA